MPDQHMQVHGGLLELKELLKGKQRELERGELDEKGKVFEWDRMREIMEGFGDAFSQHLDKEVEMLGTENMRKH